MFTCLLHFWQCTHFMTTFLTACRPCNIHTDCLNVHRTCFAPECISCLCVDLIRSMTLLSFLGRIAGHFASFGRSELIYLLPTLMRPSSSMKGLCGLNGDPFFIISVLEFGPLIPFSAISLLSFKKCLTCMQILISVSIFRI